MYLAQEDHKVEIRSNNWKCKYCGKTFRGEHYLDKHMDNRHNDTLQGSVCLADFAEALHATEVNHLLHSRLSRLPQKPCSPVVARRRLLLCQTLFRDCFPAEEEGGGPEASRLHGLFVGSLCEAHTCDSRERRARLWSLIKQTKGSIDWLRAIVAGLFVLAAILAYAFIFAMYYSEGAFSNRPDLRRRKGRWKLCSDLLLKAFGLCGRGLKPKQR